MGNTYASYLRKLRTINLVELTKEAMVENVDHIAQLNRDQMNAGIRADESSIKPDYRKITKAYKASKGQEYDFVNLRDTGEFQSKIFVRINGNQYSIYSSDSKADDLTAKYRVEIWGLTPVHRVDAWRGFLRGSVVRKMRNKLR